MVQLADQKRREYAPHAPVFQRPAANAPEIHKPWFTKLVEENGQGVFVHENDQGNVDGFAIVSIGPAPPVYDPGGLSSLMDDFTVAAPDLWETAGAALLASARAWAKSHGAVQLVVVCGPHDESKRAVLQTAGLYVASEWFTVPFE